MIDTDGFTYLTCTDSGYAGRVRGSVVGLHSGTYVNLTCAVTGERQSIAMMHLKHVSRDEAQKLMINRKHLVQSHERVRVGKIDRMVSLESQYGLRVHAFDDLSDALIAYAILHYVSGEEPVLIESDVDQDIPYDTSMEECERIHRDHIVMSSMLLDHAKFILLADECDTVLPPPVIPYWWKRLAWDQVEAETLRPKDQSYMHLLASARSYGIIRRNGCAVERDLSLPIQGDYWRYIKDQYYAYLAERDAYDEERVRIDEQDREYD